MYNSQGKPSARRPAPLSGAGVGNSQSSRASEAPPLRDQHGVTRHGVFGNDFFLQYLQLQETSAYFALLCSSARVSLSVTLGNGGSAACVMLTAWPHVSRAWQCGIATTALLVCCQSRQYVVGERRSVPVQNMMSRECPHYQDFTTDRLILCPWGALVFTDQPPLCRVSTAH